ncbi:LuxR family transcriptional regulator [Rhodococcus sp. ACPA4]|uniref:ATP-binding protein n=1 Tax=Rhodococcus sp. ACPA4 TaxID=2028571 RepID=UPI000BB147B7|nr:LuxR C-terminal-related transcriptional regulator [Rhodococcus sp. ACPA4]PBC35863.1 LuxR family transcriptional regulator [Rhodococcus sp. ACPA4]
MYPANKANLGDLPHSLTSFVGRRREISEVRHLMSVSRLVTLTGVGGVGKTRLALRVAVDSRRAFEDGVWLVGLGELNDTGAVVDTVSATLNLREGGGTSLEDLLVEYLTSRKLLLILDNCEHLVESIADLTSTLLHSCPDLRVLATSREPLGIGGEAVFRVPPLTMPEPDRQPTISNGLNNYEAIRLFAERAATAAPDFAITERNQDVVLTICRRLDGLPLAIELAAVRLRAMSANQILQRLTDRYALLTKGSRGAPARQQTLQWCIDWSHDLCSHAEREMWGRLTVFSGSFELDAVEGICAGNMPPTQVVDVVTSLIDKSILIQEGVDGTIRYRLLETLRDYGMERLQETSEVASLLRRHRDWYERAVIEAERNWIGPQQMDWIAMLNAEQPNVRAALQFCLTWPIEAEAGLRMANGLYPYWRARGKLREGIRWLRQLLAVADCKSGFERIKGLYVLSVMSALHGDADSSLLNAQKGSALAAQVDDPTATALMADAAGHHALFTHDFAGASAHFESSLAAFRTEGHILYMIWSLLGLAVSSSAQGDWARSDECHREILQLTESCGESVYRGWSLLGAGIGAWNRGNFSRAKELAEEGVRLARSADNRLGAAGCIEVLTWIATDEGIPRRSATLMGIVEAIAQTVGSPSAVYPNLLVHQEPYEKRVRQSMGDRAFTSAFRDGFRMRFEDAAAFALNEATGGFRAPAVSKTTSLTRREREVAQLVAQGMTNKSIAAKLVISQRTAQGHVEHILRKLGFTSRSQIAAWSIEQSQSAEPE